MSPVKRVPAKRAAARRAVSKGSAVAEGMPSISDAELAVLKVLWELGAGTVAAVRERFNQEHGRVLAYNTLLTFLRRLEQKGAVLVDKLRQPYVYTPIFKPRTTLGDRVRRFIDAVFDGKVDGLILQLVEDESLSEEDLVRIQKKLKREARGKPEGRP